MPAAVLVVGAGSTRLTLPGPFDEWASGAPAGNAARSGVESTA